jgi:diadenosine tetraphosphatase ApaH/serine/threonine PP2A family protein phosphatase
MSADPKEPTPGSPSGATVRYLVLSDIHANMDALEAVLAAAVDQWDQVLVLGDLVGYGAEPNEVVDRVKALNPRAVIRGNHDKAACGLDNGENFNQIARFAAAWTHQQLTPANRAYLRTLPHGPTVIDDRLEICHGAPFDEDHYIFDALDARRSFDSARRPVCLFGHTHLPVIFTTRGAQLAAEIPDADLRALTVTPDVSYLVNPGSVGQPRDGDARAAFAYYWSDGTIIFRRVEYDVGQAQRKISAAGLPQTLANRLAVGR